MGSTANTADQHPSTHPTHRWIEALRREPRAGCRLSPGPSGTAWLPQHLARVL